MIEKDRPQDKNHIFQEKKISRRTAMRQIGGAALGGLVFGAYGWQKSSDFLESRNNKDPYVDINNYRYGYPTVVDSRKERLFSTIEKSKARTFFDELSDEEIKGRLEAKESSPHILLIKDEPDPFLSINIVELGIQNKNIIVPIVQSAEHSQTCIYLGDMNGEEAFSIKKMDIPFPNTSKIDSLKVEAYSLDSPDPFVMGAIRNIPELYVREDNSDDSSVANDIPLAFDVQLRESWRNVRLIEYTSVFSGEDGGSAPYPLIDREGRLTDNEAFAFTKMTENGLIVEEAYQGKSHSVVVTHLYHDQPKVPVLNERQQYRVDTDNNMVTPGSKTGRSFSFLPDFFQIGLGIIDWEKMRDRNKAMRAISIRESVNQGYLTSDDKYIQWFIKNELDGNDLITPFVQLADVQK